MLPVIRLDTSNKEETARKLREACIEYGFFYLAGHGIQQQQIQDVLFQTKLLFDCPEQSKRNLHDPVLNRGYTAMEEETLDPIVQAKSGRGDTKEGYYIGRDVPASDPRYNPSKLCGPNVWPDPNTCPELKDPDLFRSIMETYYSSISKASIATIRLLAVALQLPENYFDHCFSEAMASIRLLHYAAVTSQPEEGLFACGAHSDYGMLTLLITDGTPGLQILTKGGVWMDVPPVPVEDTTNENNNNKEIEPYFVVNLGDMLERWTNGLFRSTMHRVVTDGTSERYSIPFFQEPNFDTIVQCLDVCCSEDNPPKYPPTTSGQHLLDKYKQTHAEFKPTD